MADKEKKYEPPTWGLGDMAYWYQERTEKEAIESNIKVLQAMITMPIRTEADKAVIEQWKKELDSLQMELKEK